MKSLILLLLFACSFAPSVEKLRYKQTINNRNCLKPLKKLEVSAPQRLQSAFIQTTGTAGSYLLTSAGVVTDTVVVTTGFVGTVYLCSQSGGNSGCGEAFGGYMGVMEHLDLLWSTKKAYNASSSWRCPYVDHITKAFRKASSCLHDKGEYVAAFEQLNIIEDDVVLNECVSRVEKSKIELLRTELTSVRK